MNGGLVGWKKSKRRSWPSGDRMRESKRDIEGERGMEGEMERLRGSGIKKVKGADGPFGE